MSFAFKCLPSGVAAVAVLFATAALAGVFGQVRGVVHDPNHRPLAGARVTLAATNSNYVLAVASGPDGTFSAVDVPFGEYRVKAEAAGFASQLQNITVRPGVSEALHFQLSLQPVSESVEVHAVQPDSVTPTTDIARADIDNTPGADRTNSLQMITVYVPGAYVTHDMLHMRGGHQVSFLMDGVQLPNTNIASNVGAAISPRDISQVQAERGSYSASTGDRTYGVFDIAPRTGFEMDRQGELTVTGGTQGQTDDQISFGGHTQRAAWYLSANGSRSDYGLAPPIATAYHDAANGAGVFGTLLLNRSVRDQLRIAGQARRDFFQVPYDPDPDSFENQQYDSSGLRDTQHERDAFGLLTWAHSFNNETVLELSPFYHYNLSAYAPGAADVPVATTSDRTSQYTGAQLQTEWTPRHHALQAGIYGFGQHDAYLFGTASPCPPVESSQCARASAAGGLVEEFVSDSWHVRPWLTLNAGVRASRFTSQITDSVVYPRIGAAVQVPKLNWIFRGFYGRFYQPPPLFTLPAALLQQTPAGVAPLHGERDEEHQFGVQIPVRGWVLDADTFRTRVNNFLDHANIGESSIFVPVTVDGALVRAWELTLRSPRLWHTAKVHLAYSNQIAEQRGAITGGLLCAPDDSDCNGGPAYVPVDHDQRNTLSLGGDAALPRHFTASANFSYGSGFVNGDPNPATPYPNAYLPAHSSFDLSVGKAVGENWNFSVVTTNVAGQRRLLDNSLTYGGFHYSDPREVYGEVKWRFHF